MVCFRRACATHFFFERDGGRLIGWSAKQRQKGLHLMAYNCRFLILPWVKVASLASHILANMAKIVSKDWLSVYSHPIYFLETFVDKQRFAATCYKAANWLYLGDTTGPVNQSGLGLWVVKKLSRYLTALQQHHTLVRKNPQDWMPWNYTKAMPESNN